MLNLTKFFLASLLVVYCQSEKHFSYEFGHPVDGEKLLKEKTVHRLATNGWRLYQPDTYAHFHFLQEGVENPAIITHIVLDDMHDVEDNSYCKAIVDILRGGVGKTYVQIALASLRDHGFLYRIRIYGKTPDP